MSLDRATRNALAAMVGKARERLKLDVMDQLRRLGFQDDGTVLDLDAIGALSEGDRAAGQELRALLEHFAASEAESGESSAARRKAAYDRLAREIGFTTLNRLVALRMAEERGLIVQSVGDGLGSRGFQVYERVAGTALGSRVETYRAYLECLYDEIARDLPVLFDRTDPQSRIFPGERCLENVLAWLNDPALANLWNEDETIGWVYQYYNDPDERKKMRESQAPRTSRELAVRNQFFTPRYVVEFLTDNTLGRLWYEMRQGDTRLVEQCAYLVRRKHTVFLTKGQQPPAPFDPASGGWGDPDALGEMWTRPNPDLHDLHDIMRYALTVGGYAYAQQYMGRECDEVVRAVEERRREKGKWESSFEELRCTLFARQRAWHHWGYTPEGDWTAEVQALYRAVCGQWDLEAEYVPYRAPQPPRRIKVLDPACGSCHFLLYAFDLLATMYEEAEPALPRHEIPALILKHNLHGIDIDPRAVQIAGLALYLKARKYDPAARVAGMNIVCAAPMPGERRMFEEFLAGLNSPTLARIADAMWDELKLAGVAGSLLKPEQRLREVVAEQRKLYQASSRERQLALLPDYEQPEQLPLDFSDVTDDSFWDIAEERILTVLRDYSEQADGDATTRHLFAEDSMQGFRFVDLMRKRYDVVLMNPPFGDGVVAAKDVIDRLYPYSKNDLLATFVERGLDLLHYHGRVGAITSRTVFFLSSFQKWREQIVFDQAQPMIFADLGHGVMDAAMVEAAAYCLEHTQRAATCVAVDNNRAEAIQTFFVRLLTKTDKEGILARTIAGICDAQPNNGVLYVVNSQSFSEIPSSPLAYWVSEALRRKFAELPPFASAKRSTRVGLHTGNDFRFVRLWWEVPPLRLLSGTGASDSESVDAVKRWWRERTYQDQGWAPLAKGGGYSPYYGDLHTVLNWERDGQELKAWANSLYGGSHWSRVLQGVDYYFRPGITWPLRGIYFSAQAVPQGAIFSVAGKLATSDERAEWPILLALMNSHLFDDFIGLFAGKVGGVQYKVGLIGRVPIPQIPRDSDLAPIATKAALIRTELERQDERSHPFSAPALLQVTNSTLVDRFCQWRERVFALDESFRTLQARLDGIVHGLYKISAEDRRMIHLSPASEHSIGDEINDRLESDERNPEDKFVNLVDQKGLVANLLSYTLGCIFGRWDIRIGRNYTLATTLGGTFDPLPVCSSGMLTEDARQITNRPLSYRPERLPAKPEDLPSNYPLLVQWSGILVDDPEQLSDDLVCRARDVLAYLWGEDVAAIEEEILAIFKLKELRDYYRKPSAFFASHVNQYSSLDYS